MVSAFSSRLIPKITKLEALSKNQERFRNIKLNIYEFGDSLAFLGGSLADVTEDLVKSGHTFPLLDQSGLVDGDRQKKLLLRKGRTTLSYTYFYLYVSYCSSATLAARFFTFCRRMVGC